MIRVGRTVVRGIGLLSLIGGTLFLLAHLKVIAFYLMGSGLIFLAFTLGWAERYQNVLAQVPEGFRPTGEVYENPGGKPVAVYYKGIRRVYVYQHSAN